MKKRILLLLLTAFIAEHAPYRLAALLAETPFLSVGLSRLPEGSSHYWDARDLQIRLGQLGWDVSYVKDLRDAHGNVVFGLTIPESLFYPRGIQLEENLSWDARYMILGHESGHAFAPTSALFYDENFAEAVGAAVTKSFTREYARRLVRNRAGLWVLVAEWREIYRIAAMLNP